MCRLMCTCMYNVICIHMQERIVCQSVSWSLVEYYSFHFACCFSTAMLRCFTLSSMCVSLWSIPCSSCPIAILHSASSCDVTVSTVWGEWLTFVPWTGECCSETQGTTNWDNTNNHNGAECKMIGYRDRYHLHTISLLARTYCMTTLYAYQRWLLYLHSGRWQAPHPPT